MLETNELVSVNTFGYLEMANTVVRVTIVGTERLVFLSALKPGTLADQSWIFTRCIVPCTVAPVVTMHPLALGCSI